MGKGKAAILVAIGIGIAAIAILASGLAPLQSPAQKQNNAQDDSAFSRGSPASECGGTAACFRATVTSIVDGDTIDVGDTRIRLSLVNTPEVDEAGYEGAKQFTASLCPAGSEILVDQDDGQLEDRFGRMLAKVTCTDNKILNAELLRSGQAGILTEYCAVSEFSSEEWTRGYGCGAPTTVDENMNCDSSYPDVCIPPPPPDLDCGEIPYRNFTVLPPDPHRFDGDKDGIGCET